MNIYVTAKDIKNGKPGSLSSPVALAINRRAPWIKLSAVTEHHISFTEDDLPYYTQVVTPYRAADFIRRFDAGSKLVRPMRFSVDLKAIRFFPPVQTVTSMT